MIAIDAATLLSGGEYLASLRRLIGEATSRIWVLQFLIDARPAADQRGDVRYLLHALAEAAHRGLDVRVVLPTVVNPGYPPTYDINDAASWFLTARGVEVRRYSGSQTRPSSHAKLVIIDTQIVLCGNANWTRRAFHVNAEQTVAVRSVELAERLSRNFRHVWAKRCAPPPDHFVRQAPPALPVDPAVPASEPVPARGTFVRRDATTYWPRHRRPLDPYDPAHPGALEAYAKLMGRLLPSSDSATPLAGQRYVATVTQLFAAATQRIWLSMMGLRAFEIPRLRNLIRGLGAAHARGVDVRVIYEPRDGPRTDWTEDVRPLASLGVPRRRWALGPHLHARSVVIDDRHAVVGSVGWTPRSVFITEELSIHLDSRAVAEEVARQFETWWSAAGGQQLDAEEPTAASPTELYHASGTLTIGPLDSKYSRFNRECASGAETEGSRWPKNQ